MKISNFNLFVNINSDELLSFVVKGVEVLTSDISAIY